jgi:hypothetical protein
MEGMKSKSWRTVLGAAAVIIGGCGLCCLPLIAPLLASLGVSMGLAAYLDELSVWHFIAITGSAIGVFIIIRRRRLAQQKCKTECECASQCDVS